MCVVAFTILLVLNCPIALSTLHSSPLLLCLSQTLFSIKSFSSLWDLKSLFSVFSQALIDLFLPHLWMFAIYVNP